MKGFTLIELMIVIVIVGILAMVAVPAYNSSVQKSRRSDGMSSLVAVQLEMEKMRGSCALFPTALDSTISADDCANRKLAYTTTSSDGHYNLAIVAANSTGNAFKITADPVGAQAEDTDCDPLSITVNGTYPKGLKEPAACW